MVSAIRLYRFKSVAIGLPALLSAASCVPQDAPAAAAAHALEPAAGRLLRRLALTVPATVATTPLAGQAIGSAIASALPFLAATRSPDDAGRAVDCLTAAVYYEARSQALDGQRAVAQVVLNRVRDRAFPNSVCGVVYQGSARRTGCQFTFTCDGSMAARRDERAWDIARTVASAALGGAVYAPVGSATYYHADSVMPWWAPSLAKVAVVGSHIFYRWRGAMERALAYSQGYSGIEPEAPSIVAPSSVVGVTIHRGDDAGGVVVVHRGTAPSAAMIRVAAPAWGIRIHYGASRTSDVSAAEGAVVSDEL